MNVSRCLTSFPAALMLAWATAAIAGPASSPSQRSPWLDTTLQSAAKGPCADNAKACVARCQGDVMAQMPCKQKCDQQRMQCALRAADAATGIDSASAQKNAASAAAGGSR